MRVLVTSRRKILNILGKGPSTLRGLVDETKGVTGGFATG